ncbi:hypothetical protein AGMMS49944_15590 [Spirochaetia bacterium]|nr:hypothetical protein AGMMS49944_15590 [Spirochaetia bacterium]
MRLPISPRLATAELSVIFLRFLTPVMFLFLTGGNNETPERIFDPTDYRPELPAHWRVGAWRAGRYRAAAAA